MFKRIARSVSTLFGENTVERWTPQKLAAVKAYLEKKPPEAFTREDHYLCVDYLFHRYYPQDLPMTTAAWRKKRREIEARIDRSLDHPEEASARQKEITADPDFATWLKKTLNPPR